MKIAKTNISSLMVLLLLIISIFPIINIGGFGMPILYLLIPIEVLLMILIIFERRKTPVITKYIILIYMLIIGEILVSTLYGTGTNLGKFMFPTEIIQYIARMLVCVLFIDILYKNRIKEDLFIKYLLIVFNIAMLIGVLQWVPWLGREFFVKLYPFREGIEQLVHLSRSMSGIRVHGIAQMATANGGLAVFFFVIGWSVYKYYQRYSKLALSLSVVSIVNILASQSRGGQIVLIFVIFLFYIIDIYITGKSFKPTFYFCTSLISIFGVGGIMYIRGNPIIYRIIYRWNALFASEGNGRVEDAGYFLGMIETPVEFLLGISKQVMNVSGISHGVEIEPLSIFITYGMIGFIIHYCLILVIVMYLFKKIKISTNNKACLTLVIASFIGLLGYQMFSMVYFFFKEIRVGLFPWIFIGATIGIVEKNRLESILSKPLDKIRREK